MPRAGGGPPFVTLRDEVRACRVECAAGVSMCESVTAWAGGWCLVGCERGLGFFQIVLVDVPALQILMEQKGNFTRQFYDNYCEACTTIWFSAASGIIEIAITAVPLRRAPSCGSLR